MDQERKTGGGGERGDGKGGTCLLPFPSFLVPSIPFRQEDLGCLLHT